MGAFDLKGRVAVVTGGNGGIGLGMARGLAEAGAALVLAARNREKSARAVAELKALGADAESVTVDVTDEASVGAMVKETMARFSRLDILVNNAGTNIRKPPHELSLDELKKTFASLGDLLFVVMSGGEPFLRRDLPEVCETLSNENHVKQITIPTGAIASDLIARSVESTLERCPDTQIVVNLSLDHIGEKHDWIRGVPGNYEKARKTYANLMALRDRYEHANPRASVTSSAIAMPIMP